MTFRGTAAGTLLFALGCGTPTPPDAVSVRDSAGVQIVESRRRLWDEGGAWIVDPRPALVLDDALEPVDAVVMRGGRIVVLDRMLPGLLVYDSAGTLVTKIGREGRGPGEFLRPSRVFAYGGDSLGTYDDGTMRVDLRSLDGVYGRSVYVRPGLSRATFVGSFVDGSFVFRGDGFHPGSGRWREPVEVFRVSADGDGIEKIAVLPGWEFYSAEFQGRPRFGVTPYGPRTLISAAISRVAVHVQEDCLLRLLDERGRTSSQLFSPCVERTLTDEQIEEFRAFRVAGIGTEDARQVADRFYRSRHVPYPDHVPAYDRLINDVEGNLWAELYPLTGDPTKEWRVFDTGGRWLGEVPVPGQLDLQWVGHDRIIGLSRDEMGVQRLEIHLLTRGKE